MRSKIFSLWAVAEKLRPFFPYGDSSEIPAFLLFGESGKREPWEWSLQASLGRGMPTKEIMEDLGIGFISKKLSFMVIYPGTQQQFPPPSVAWEHMWKQEGISFSALQATLPFLTQPRSSIKCQALAHLCLGRGETEAGAGFWEPLGLGRCELTFPLLMIKKVSPRAPWRMMYSPLS